MPAIETIRDPSGSVIKVTEKTQHWSKYLTISFRGPCIYPERERNARLNLDAVHSTSIKIKSPVELHDYLDQIVEPELFDSFVAIQEGGNAGVDVDKRLSIAPHGRAAGAISIIDNTVGISGKGNSYYSLRRVKLDSPADTIGHLNEFLRAYQ